MTGGSGPDAAARAAALIGLFVSPPAAFGAVSPVEPGQVPEPFRSLLDHASHMTVAMERHHGGPVGLRVVATADGGGDTYAREIVLTDRAGRIVQFGIVRLDLAAVDAATAARIRAQALPLGRILIEAGTLCEVGDVALVRIEPGPHLREFIGPRPTYGRVAGIAIDGRSAVELLEVAAAG